MKKKAELLRCTILLLISLGAGLALSLFPETAARGAAQGLNVCLSVLVPSLFPFLVLSVFLVRSGAAALLGKLLEGPMRFLFRLPGCCAPVILMGMAGGYPVGARGTAALLQAGEIDEKQARRMTLFCVNAGPAFVLSAVGAGFLHSPRAGGILLASGLSASLVLGLLLRGRDPLTARPRSVSRAPAKAGDALVASAFDACRSLAAMCCFVILFAVILEFLSILIAPGMTLACLSAVLEITGGCRDLAAQGAPLWVFAAALGWGGLSVQLQILSLPGAPRLSFPRFALARLAHAVLAVPFAVVLNAIFPPEITAQEVFSNTSSQPAADLGGSPIAAGALLVCCAVFLAACYSPRFGAGRGKKEAHGRL